MHRRSPSAHRFARTGSFAGKKEWRVWSGIRWCGRAGHRERCWRSGRTLYGPHRQDSFCREGLWYAWAIGAEGELRLGVLEPAGRRPSSRRRLSQRSMAPLGKLVRGEVRPAGAVREDWKPAPEPDRLFHTPWLRQQLRGVEGALTERRGTLRYLALPFDQRRPFPLAPLFCLARLRELNGAACGLYLQRSGLAGVRGRRAAVTAVPPARRKGIVRRGPARAQQGRGASTQRSRPGGIRAAHAMERPFVNRPHPCGDGP